MIQIDLPWPPRELHPNADDIREAFSYDYATGVLVRIKKTGPNVRVGAEAGWLDKSGYRRVRFMGKSWAVHRLAWIHYYGINPPDLIDHINGDRADNRISNLRQANRSINTQNLKRSRCDNRLGVLGVRARGNSFEARIMLDGRPHHLGTFESKDAAAAAYLEAKRGLHPGGTL